MRMTRRVEQSGLRWIATVVAVSAAATFLMMSLTALIERPADWRPSAGAEMAMYVHLFTVVPAVPLGAIVLWGRKGTSTHRILGRIWGGLMMVTAISSFWLQGLSGGLGFIHLFSVLTLVSIPLGIYHARRGNIRGHMNAMRSVYAGLIAAGLFSAAPGRLLGVLVFG